MTPTRIHEYTAIFPLMEGDALDALVADIRLNGQREPIVVTVDGAILDGRNRALACARIGIEPITRVCTAVDLLSYVVSANLHRRQLTPAQLGLVAGRIATLRHGQHRDTPVGVSLETFDKTTSEAAEATPVPTITQAEAASLVGSSSSAVQRARVVLTRGVAEVVHAVETGALQLNTAATIAKRPPDEQPALVSAHVSGKRVTQGAHGKAARLKQIRDLADEGLTSFQIAHRVHMSAEHCRNLMRANAIVCHGDRATRNTKRVNPNRILDGIVEALVDAPTDLTMIDIRTIDRAQIPRWLAALAESQRAIARLVGQLRKLAHTYQEGRTDAANKNETHATPVENSTRAH